MISVMSCFSHRTGGTLVKLAFLECSCTGFCKHAITLNFRSNCSITSLVLIWLLILIFVSDPEAGVKTDV